MNNLNKIFAVVVFVFLLLSTVFITNSYAEIVANELYSQGSITTAGGSYNTSSIFIGDYTVKEVMNILKGYANGDDLYTDSYNEIISLLENDGYVVQAWKYYQSNTYRIILYYWLDNGLDMGIRSYINSSNVNYFDSYFLNSGSDTIRIQSIYSHGNGNSGFNIPVDSDVHKSYSLINSLNYELIYSSLDVKLLELSTIYIVWDGESYFYKSDTGSDTPTFPTNQEVADAVQKFYNSDIYKNNTKFKDFMVVYSSFKNTYAFIGTDNHLIQAIFYDGVEVPGMNFSSPDTWWMFTSKFGDIQSFLFGSKFYLYFIEGNSDLITNEGIGTLYDLFDLKFTTSMTIVYSTYDYDVIEYRPPAEGETDNQITSGTIEGDSYTYDENLNPTDSQYSPLQNFVSSNPTQSILNDVDFDSINQAFEDSKGILNIQGASWIFSANNQFVEYFIGFITLLIILLVISRIMGG